MDEPHPGHALCGYLCTVLTLPAPKSLPFLSPCHVASEGDEIFFRTENGVVLSPATKTGNGEAVSRRRRRGMGRVNGSLSVVHQLHSLVSHKCLKVTARVLHVEVGEGEEEVAKVRVVVLVDVYLPLELWSGCWQFPKCGPVAGSLFAHLSCDWGKRSSMLVDGGENCASSLGGRKSIWELFDCHVLGCKLHLDAPDSARKMRFELHEIFKGLPSVTSKGTLYCSRMKKADNCHWSGIWDLTDDVLISILTLLDPLDLVRVAATCHHLRSLAVSVMPCMKLKLFPHQQAAVEWMLQREQNAEVLPHPLYMNFSSEGGFRFFVNTVSGEIVTEIAPTVRDFRGGMFCDEPGLGKTITALSLILKTQGKMTDPPDGVQITWCTHNGDHRCGYYELSGDDFASISSPLGKRVMNHSTRRGLLSLDNFTPMHDLNYSARKKARLTDAIGQTVGTNNFCPDAGKKSLSAPCSEAAARVVRCSRSLSRIKKNLLYAYEEFSCGNKVLVRENLNKRKNDSKPPTYVCQKQRLHISHETSSADNLVCNDTWVQCEACRKWRKLTESVADTTAAWFCSMNTDPRHQTCRDPEEAWDNYESITYFPGFFTKGTQEGKMQNVSFFISVLREHYPSINSKTKKALSWLAKLSSDKLSQMETIGLAGPALGTCPTSGNGDVLGFHKVFQAFGLVRRVVKGVSRWYYPQTLDNLAFDLAALRIALCEPLDSVRLYLSRATLIVVPANLVDHWKTQIQKYIKPGQLRLCIWTDHKKPSAHSLAWDYDVVIITFNRLSAEWGPNKKSPLMQVHWLRVVLDEGHTLGSCLNLTNKLQMAISLTASNRWLLTGTPTPNTPDGQLSHLQPMLRFLHEESYGQNQKSWETGILRPFEAELEEGRIRLLELLNRCLISARKIDMKTIPPCIKKVTFLNFTEEHARSYNELVVTVRRNILMADWNDPSHVESLLNSKQWKFRSATIKNVRLSCCVAGHIKVSDAGEDIQETMDVLVENGLDPISEEYALIKYYLQYGGNCLRCKEWCRLPVVTPCRHLLCLDCVALDSERCTFPSCGNLYEMQTPDTLTRPENPNPKWPVPKDLIELQPSYKQDDWDPDWQSTSSSKVAYLVQRLKKLQEINRESCYSMDKNNESWNIEQQHCISQMNNLSALPELHCSRHSLECHRTALEKVIVFSQFLEHIHVIEQQLTFAGIKFAGLYSPMHSSNKMKSLAMFQHDADCMALVMDGSAALGLDLSFVTHVFLMEPIWDRSIEEQVISRAHRMGATRPIHVETLAMHGTIEEQMLEFLQDDDVRRRFLKGEFGKTDNEGARAHRSLHDFAESNYLARLSFVHTSSRA